MDAGRGVRFPEGDGGHSMRSTCFDGLIGGFIKIPRVVGTPPSCPSHWGKSRGGGQKNWSDPSISHKFFTKSEKKFLEQFPIYIMCYASKSMPVTEHHVKL